ncbi:MAG TPA: hypothetical protein VJ739_03450 [Gemmataceae bacterium]|nr:hypothetical protein [Gemmataceae bacterium]
MKAVSRYEARLLRLLHAFLRRLPLDQVRPLVDVRAEEAPKCLSRDAVLLVQDALAKGTTALLAGASAWRREGVVVGDGWRRDRFLRGERPVTGRLWERTPPEQLGLEFSGQSLEFLLWIGRLRPRGVEIAWEPTEKELTVGDQLLLFVAFETLRPTQLAPILAAQAVFQRHGLCRLAFPESYPPSDEKPAPRFLPWTGGVGACVLEALQRGLAERLVAVEHHKGEVTDWQELRRIGHWQGQALSAFLDAVEEAERPDLARFVLEAAAGVLTDDATAARWTAGLRQVGPRLADRAETIQAALALVRQVGRLRGWEQAARGVGYFDEGYARGQLWLADWERCDGDRVFARAQAVLYEADPMRQAE